MTRNSEPQIDTAKIPQHDADRICSTIVGMVRELFKSSAVQKDFEQWKQNRTQRQTEANT